MTHGIDTDFLVAVEIRDHPFHRQAEALLLGLLGNGYDFAVAPQTLAEFIHVVTDPKRMPHPLSISEAIARAEHWRAGRRGKAGFPRWPGRGGFSRLAVALSTRTKAVSRYAVGGHFPTGGC